MDYSDDECMVMFTADQSDVINWWANDLEFAENVITCSEDGADTQVNCTSPTCDDGVQNGTETGVDCGGSDCEPCDFNCGDVFVDSGGSASEYFNHENFTWTICASGTDVVKLTFTEFEIEAGGSSGCYDELELFDGADNMAPSMGIYCGETINDAPGNGVIELDKIQLNFTYVDIEAASGNGNNGTGCWDLLKIYDGQNDSAPMIGNYCGEESGDGDISSISDNNLSVGMEFESTDPSGCLYFIFESDASNNETGWEAEINCAALSAVPLELLSFSAIAKEDEVLLEWTTTNEINNKGVYVQRSIDGDHFEDIGFVAGSPSPQNVNAYSYQDREMVSSGTYFYRLKQMDFDGSTELSRIVSVSLLSNRIKPLFYPNPTTGNVYLEIALVNEEVLEEVLIYNKLGQLVKNNHYATKGTSRIELKTDNLEKGIYIIVLKTTLNTHIQQITKL